MGSTSDDFKCPICGKVGPGYAPDVVGFPVCSFSENSCHHKIQDGRSTEVGIVAGALYHIFKQGALPGEIARIIPTFFLDIAEYLKGECYCRRQYPTMERVWILNHITPFGNGYVQSHTPMIGGRRVPNNHYLGCATFLDPLEEESRDIGIPSSPVPIPSFSAEQQRANRRNQFHWDHFPREESFDWDNE